jgi:hypothetical protein
VSRKPRPRPDNGALESLLEAGPPLDPKLERAISSMPELAEVLNDLAETEARYLCELYRAPHGAMQRAGLSRAEALAHCILDLMLTECFWAYADCFHDQRISSLLVDSLLFQATGYAPNSATELDVICHRTHELRGVQKYAVAQAMRINQLQLLGTEADVIIRGRPGIDVGLVTAAHSIGFCARAKFAVRFALYGTLPSEEEKRAVDQTLQEAEEKLEQTLRELTSCFRAPEKE